MSGKGDGDPNPRPFEEVYELNDRIGTGGFGSVHTAINFENGDEVAVKVINRSKLKGKDHEVFREAQALRELSSHPNIISLVDFFVSPETLYVVLELARGGDLFDSIARRKFFSEKDARSVAREILMANSYMHSKGFVHRDMKPENLLLGKSSKSGVKVGDFGFAKNLRDAPTSAGLVSRCGTPAYVAPELVMGNPYKTDVDVWGCGVILFLLLGGYLPFQGKGQVLYRQILASDFEFHKQYWGLISVEAKQLITRMLAIDPKTRITADEALNSSWMAISDDNVNMSSRNLSSTIEGLKKFNAKRRLKAVMHMANIVQALPFFKTSRVSFMPEETTTGSTESGLAKSQTLESGKIGQDFDSLYGLLSELRSKGDTTVWTGLEKKTRKAYNIRIIKRGNSTNDDAEVLNEVAILASLRHQYVVKLRDYFEETSRFLVISDFMSGGDVFDRILKNHKYTEKSAQALARSLLTAVEYIHSCGIAHRDLKPQNLLLESPDSDHNLKITNFKFARRVHTPQSLITRCGTPTYVAPEILKNQPHDEMVDMWSVGVIIYVLLVGYPPFMEEKQRDLFRKVRQGEYGFDGKDWKKVSKSAKKLIKKLLVVDPSRRLTARKALQQKWIMSEKSMSSTLNDSQRQLQTVAKISRKEYCDRLPVNSMEDDDDVEYDGNACIDYGSDTDDSDDEN